MYEWEYTYFKINSNIIIFGTSSAGKSSIINEFPRNYNKISWDNIFEEFGYTFFQVCEYKNYKNKYYKQKEKDKFFMIAFITKKCLFWILINYKLNYYIDIDDIIILKQKCLRTLEAIQKDKRAIDDLVNNNERFIKMAVKGIKKDCSLKEVLKMNNRWKKDYKKMGYKFLSREEIFKDVSNLLTKKI